MHLHEACVPHRGLCRTICAIGTPCIMLQLLKHRFIILIKFIEAGTPHVLLDWVLFLLGILKYCTTYQYDAHSKEPYNMRNKKHPVERGVSSHTATQESIPGPCTVPLTQSSKKKKMFKLVKEKPVMYLSNNLMNYRSHAT